MVAVHTVLGSLSQYCYELKNVQFLTMEEVKRRGMLLAYATVCGYQIGVPAQASKILKGHHASVDNDLVSQNPQVWRERIFLLAYKKGCDFFEASSYLFTTSFLQTSSNIRILSSDCLLTAGCRADDRRGDPAPSRSRLEPVFEAPAQLMAVGGANRMLQTKVADLG